MFIKNIVLITGCSSGFGFRTALVFARNGYITYASVRNTKSKGAIDLQNIAKQEHLLLKVIEIDVSLDQSVDKGVAYIGKKNKRIDILINNAVRWCNKGPVEEYSIEDIVEQYQTNVFGMLRMVKAVVPIMRKNKKGLIINISSINGRIPLPMAGIYASAKHAVEALTETLRLELSHFGISVTMVEPGSFLTEGYSRDFKKLHTLHIDNSVYKPLADLYIKNLTAIREKEQSPLMKELFDPQRVSDLIFKISQKRKPKLRYKIGIDTHAYYMAKKMLPERVWEWILHKAYRW